MARSFECRSVFFSLWLAMAGTAAGQAMVEYGLGAGRAATTAAPAGTAGKAIRGLAGNLDKALKAGQQGADAQLTTVKASSPRAEATAPLASKWEDPGGIEAGLTYQEMVRRFGPPAMEITSDEGKSVVYAGKGGTFHIDVQGDQVTSVRKPKA